MDDNFASSSSWAVGSWGLDIQSLPANVITGLSKPNWDAAYALGNFRYSFDSVLRFQILTVIFAIFPKLLPFNYILPKVHHQPCVHAFQQLRSSTKTSKLLARGAITQRVVNTISQASPGWVSALAESSA